MGNARSSAANKSSDQNGTTAGIIDLRKVIE